MTWTAQTVFHSLHVDRNGFIWLVLAEGPDGWQAGWKLHARGELIYLGGIPPGASRAQAEEACRLFLERHLAQGQEVPLPSPLGLSFVQAPQETS